MITDGEVKRIADESGMEAWWVSGNENYEEFEAVLAHFARAIYQLGRQHQRESDVPDCNTCANRGKAYGLSQESYCEHCKWAESWRKDLFEQVNRE